MTINIRQFTMDDPEEFTTHELVPMAFRSGPSPMETLNIHSDNFTTTTHGGTSITAGHTATRPLSTDILR